MEIMQLHSKLIKIIRRSFLSLLLLIIFLITGCSFSVPEPDENNQALLIFPVETRQTLPQFIWTLHISIEETSSNSKHKHIVEPNPEMLFSYTTKLKPGKYKITKMVRKAKTGHKIGGKKKNRGEKIGNLSDFILENGKVTILEKKILLLQPESRLSKPPKRRQPNQQKQTDAERNLDRIKREKQRKKERDADREQMKKQKVKWVQILDLDESFKSNLMKKLKEVENFEKWK